MQLDKFKTHNKEIYIKFTCHRCNKEIFLPAEQQFPKENEYRDGLNAFLLPKGWHEWWGRVLCPDCDHDLMIFLDGEVK